MRPRRIVLVDPDPETREVYAQRLRAQGFIVDEAPDGVVGAEVALADPPIAVVSDLWMPGVSGVQLCRLLRAEPATADVPVVLRAENDDARSRFWARRAGARCLVMKGRMGELVRTLSDLAASAPSEDAFFFRMAGGAQDVRDRIAEHLDRALFESVVAAEVRSLANAIAFDRLFDSLSQLVAQLVDYRWLALTTPSPSFFAIHTHRRQATSAELEARQVLSAPESAKAVRILDDDACDTATSDRTLSFDITLGGTRVGTLALGVPVGAVAVETVAPLVARELGAVIRLVTLFEESQRLATTDGLTGLYNRRAFAEAVRMELSRSDRSGQSTSLLLLDLDHFKSINDTHGHGAGDLVLATVAKTLKEQSRAYDVVGRWGGEEFIVALPETDESGAAEVAERLRVAVAKLTIQNPAKDQPIPLTVSIGAAERQSGEELESLVDRADRAMYSAKIGGRNRVRRASVEEQPVVTQAPVSPARRPAAKPASSRAMSDAPKSTLAPPAPVTAAVGQN